MTYVDSWPVFSNPSAATLAAAVLAVAAIAVLALLVLRTVRRVKRFRPQSLLLLAVPALIVAAGARVDDVRAAAHQHTLAASGQADEAWAEAEADLLARYEIRSVEPMDGTAEAFSSLAGPPRATWILATDPRSEWTCRTRPTRRSTNSFWRTADSL